jgi:integrase
MPYIRSHETTRRKNGKPAKRYEVCWREPVKDAFGVPVPLDPNRPDGPKRMRPRQERFTDRKDAEALRDKLNAAKRTPGGTTALADAREAGELPFGHYAAGWLDEQRTKEATGEIKRSTLEFYESILRVHLLPRFGDKAVGAITVKDCRAFRADLSGRLSRRTIANVWRMLRAVLRDA